MFNFISNVMCSKEFRNNFCLELFVDNEWYDKFVDYSEPYVNSFFWTAYEVLYVIICAWPISKEQKGIRLIGFKGIMKYEETSDNFGNWRRHLRKIMPRLWKLLFFCSISSCLLTKLSRSFLQFYFLRTATDD